MSEATRNSTGERIKQRLVAEIAQLEYELNTELPKELARARAHGDLSENAEYKFAKERQHYLGMRLAQLRKRLADLSLLNLGKIPRDRVGYGTQVTLLDLQTQNQVDYQLVTAEESDVAGGLISTTSPIGKALLGKQRGDVVEVQTPAGRREFEIVNLVTIHGEG